jgi:predicted secreted acid phosphatase
MASTFTKQELIEHLNEHYADESLLVVDIWSSADVEIHMDEPEEDKAMDIWVDISESFLNAFDYTTSILNDTLYEMIQEEQ